MAISTYSELQLAVETFMERNDLSGYAADFISLAEARLNRVLNQVKTSATLTGTAGSRTIDVSSLSIIDPLTLMMTDGSREYELTRQLDGYFPHDTGSAQPSKWSITENGSTITFDTLLDQDYPFRLTYNGRFALSDAAPTNDLLTYSPDIYLAATIVWGGLMVQDDQTIARYAGALESFIAEQKRIEERNNRSQLTVDPMLARLGRGWYGGTY